MVIFGKLAKLLLCYKRYVLTHPGLHLPNREQVRCLSIARSLLFHGVYGVEKLYAEGCSCLSFPNGT